MYFQIMDYGEFNGVVLERWYNVDGLIGKARRNGKFKPPFRGDFVSDYYSCFGAIDRLDQIPMSKFKGKTFRAKVRTVKRNSKQRDYPKGLQYSVIDTLKGVRDL